MIVVFTNMNLCFARVLKCSEEVKLWSWLFKEWIHYAIHEINHYPVDSVVYFVDTCMYLSDRDLTSG